MTALSPCDVESDMSSVFQIYQEVGHWLMAAPRGVKMGIPFLIPNITLGSFGAVTQVIFLGYGTPLRCVLTELS